MDGTLPANLDECQGHITTTADFSSEIYHYHVSNSSAPNLPTCLKGISARNSFVYE